jgi:hypothetical protein
MAPYTPSKNIPALVTPQTNPTWIQYRAIKKALQEMQQANNQPSVSTTSPGGQPGGNGTPATIRTFNSKSTQTTPSLRKMPITQPNFSLPINETSKFEDTYFDILPTDAAKHKDATGKQFLQKSRHTAHNGLVR